MVHLQVLKRFLGGSRVKLALELVPNPNALAGGSTFSPREVRQRGRDSRRGKCCWIHVEYGQLFVAANRLRCWLTAPPGRLPRGLSFRDHFLSSLGGIEATQQNLET